MRGRGPGPGSHTAPRRAARTHRHPHPLGGRSPAPVYQLMKRGFGVVLLYPDLIGRKRSCLTCFRDNFKQNSFGRNFLGKWKK